jgi:uncharacterized protein with PIN domain
MKYTQHSLTKLENLLRETGYDVRYEKGNFKSGYCILENKQVIVVNKFSTLETRIQSLIEIIRILKSEGKITSGEKWVEEIA